MRHPILALAAIAAFSLVMSPRPAAQATPQTFQQISPGLSGMVIDGYQITSVDDVLRVGPRLELPGLPPRVAELEPGDEVTAINGHAVGALEALRAAWRSIEPGDEVSLGIRRNGQEKTVTFDRPPLMDGSIVLSPEQLRGPSLTIPVQPASPSDEADSAPPLLSRTGSDYEVYAPTEEDLERAAQGVEQAARAYQHYFGEPAPPIALVTYNERAQMIGHELERFRERGMVAQRWTASRAELPRSRENPASAEDLQQALASGPRVPTSATTLAHEVMHALARSKVGHALPAWFNEGFAVLSEFPEGKQRHWDTLLADLDQRIPWDRLFTMPHPSQGGTIIGSSDGGTLSVNQGGRITTGPVIIQRQSDDREGPLLYAQSMALLEFVAEREGPLFVGEMAHRLAAGTSMEAILAAAPHVPGDLAELDRQWMSWVRDRMERASP